VTVILDQYIVSLQNSRSKTQLFVILLTGRCIQAHIWCSEPFCSYTGIRNKLHCQHVVSRSYHWWNSCTTVSTHNKNTSKELLL